jgi:hypothetical protein
MAMKRTFGFSAAVAKVDHVKIALIANAMRNVIPHCVERQAEGAGTTGAPRNAL